MLVCRGVPERSPGDTVVTAGIFDGVHRGHQTLIREVCSWSREIGGISCVITFTGCPPDGREDVPAVTTVEKRISLIEDEGVDVCVVLDLSNKVSSMTAEDFIRDIVGKGLGCRRMVVGMDWRFGSGRSGDIALLRSLQERGDLEVRSPEPVMYRGNVVSSTAVRDAVSDGDLDLAADLLGRRFSVSGRVVHGSGRGRTLGFPTANLDIRGLLLPPDGIYAVRTFVGVRHMNGVLSLGERPTFGGGNRSFEVFIFDMDEDIYDEVIEVEPVRVLRDERRFASAEELVVQMRTDVQQASDILALGRRAEVFRDSLS